MTTGLLVDSSSHEIRRLLLFRQTQNFLIKGACCLPKQPYFPSSTSSLKIFQTKLIVPPFEISNKCDHLDCDLVFIMHAVNIIPFYSASSLYVPFLNLYRMFFQFFNFESLILFLHELHEFILPISSILKLPV